jgi:hypothetical protein
MNLSKRRSEKPRVVVRETVDRGPRPKELQQLLEEIGSGAIADIDELEEQDLRLLRAYYGEGEELQALLDRLRDQDREER